MLNPNSLLSEHEISELKKTKDWRNYLAIFNIWSQVALGFLIFAIWPNIITFLVSSLIIGTRQFALVIMMHDGAHNLISKNKKINDFISQWLCAYPMMTETHSYRSYHLRHHKHTETESDPDKTLTDPFPVTKFSFSRKIFRDLFGIAGIRRYAGYFYSAWGPEEDKFINHLQHFVGKLYGFFICQAIILTLLTLFGSPWLYLLLWWIPKLTVFSFFYRLRNIAEHACTSGKDDFNHTRTTLSPGIIRYFIAPLNVNYHLEHHLFMFCPWYNLPKAHQMLREKDFFDELEIEEGYLNVFKKVIV